MTSDCPPTAAAAATAAATTTSRPAQLTGSVTPQAATPPKSRFGLPALYRSLSSPNLCKSMAAAVAPPVPLPAIRDDHVMDTRTPSPAPAQTAVPGDPLGDAFYKPDLSAEVALLSTKLVNAINHQTNLDDSLQHSRHELEQARHEITSLKAAKQRMDELVSGGVLVNKADVDRTIARLREELAQEKAARDAAEKGKKQVEGELENLTTALFEEANTMVAAARRDTEAVEKRNAQLRFQLQDTEMLMASQQEQLQDLKTTMEKLQEPSLSIPSRLPSMPATPVMTQHTAFDAPQSSPNATDSSNCTPEHPLHFSHLISPVLRSDTAAFGDFHDLLLTRRLGAHSRSNSSQASQGPYNSPGLNASVSASSPNLPGSFSFGNSSPTSAYHSSFNIPPLKDSKFYKRVLTEDIEPTLRLDIAPGLSFLSRRTVLGALLQGTLAVEPYPQSKHYFACTLCGEGRKDEPYVRKYRFRTSEDDNVSKPICDFCVARLRASCDFVGFLRMVREGHWKCDSEEDQKSAWEESVRLREKMFWARLGGGVVPCSQSSEKTAPQTPSSAAGLGSSRRHSLDSISEGQTTNARNLDESVEEPMQKLQVQERPCSIAAAILDTSTGAAQHAVHNSQQLRSDERAADEEEATASQQLQTELDTQAGNGAEDFEPTTPFEDASEHRELPVMPAAEAEEGKEKPTILNAAPEEKQEEPSTPNAALEEKQEEPSTPNAAPEEKEEEPSTLNTAPEEKKEEPSTLNTAPEEKKEEPSTPNMAPEEKKEEPSTPNMAPEEKKEEPSTPNTAPEEKEEEPSAPAAAPETESPKSVPVVQPKESTPQNPLQAPSRRVPRSPSPSRKRPSRDVDQSTSRKTSSVLARVRAMESSN